MTDYTTHYTTHPDYRAMLAGIRADKADDLKRLVLADWLEEHGQAERAELIRVQCRIAEIRRDCMCGGCRTSGQHHNGPCGIDRERVELPDGTTRNALLRIRNTRLVESLFASVLSPAALAGCSWDWDRGFVHTVRGPLASLIGVLPALVRDGVVERIEVTDRDPWSDGILEFTPGEYGWCWWREAEWANRGAANNQIGNLPDDVIELIAELYPENCLTWNGPRDNQHIGFPTREAAVSALSTALIAWAESEGVK